jgi:predicted AAA+ superfamily ATPase
VHGWYCPAVPSRRDFTGPYVRRVIDDELDELHPQLPAVLVDGPKGVGKTATAMRRCRTARRLDRDDELAIVAADPDIVATDEPPVLIDEWQRAPTVFDAVRRAVDERPAGGQFILTGSAPVAGAHSGAGRITTMRLRPLALSERLDLETTVSLAELLDGSRPMVRGRCPLRLADYAREITAGGFPGMRHLDGRALTRRLDGYLDRIVDHELREAGFAVRRPATVRAWLAAYAAATATTASWEKIRNAATSGTDDKPARTTTIPYVELLRGLRLLDPVEAWLPTRNHLVALTAAPKHHLADPALAARLVRRDAAQLLHGAGPGVALPRDGTFLGGLFESLAALSVRTFAQRVDAGVYHLRTGGGRHEVDFVVEADGGGITGIEVELAATVQDRDVVHLLWLRDQLGDRCADLVVLHTGPEAYRRRDGVAVVPLGLLGP